MERSTLAEPGGRLALEVKEVREEDAFGRLIRVEIEPGIVDERWRTAVEDLRRKLSLPGFRKGKVPRDVVEQLRAHGDHDFQVVEILAVGGLRVEFGRRREPLKGSEMQRARTVQRAARLTVRRRRARQSAQASVHMT